MNKKIPALFAVLAILAVIPIFAAQSRSTEYHKTGLKINKNITLNIKFPNGFFVKGTIKGPNGAAVEGAIVFVGAASEQYSGYLGSTDEAGKFSIPVQAGKKYLRIVPLSSDSVDPAKFSRLLQKIVENINVTKDTAVSPVKLKNGYILSGKVDPPAGTGALKTFSPSIRVVVPNAKDFGSLAQTGGPNDDISNKYAVALPAGSYRIGASAGGTTVANQIVQMQPTIQNVKVSKDTVKNITLPKGGNSLSGTVKDASNTKLDGILCIYPQSGPFEGRMLALCMVTKGVFGYDTDLNLKNLFISSGSYTLMFVPLSYISADYKGKATVSYFDLTMPAAAKTLALVAKNGFVVSGKTTDANGKAMQAIIGATNKSAQVDFNPLALNGIFALSDDKGNYRIALPADTFNFQALPIPSDSSSLTREKMLQRLIRTAISR
ncbi:MAG: carboxypeptidase-like regulatory domain-containing protein [Candidatus Aminicenantes bacterium]|nr:carboxypeptidase-like regulatory domain-containing protein [Candidatus Aminicenantes bacterium]